jgi:hypothetical protein
MEETPEARQMREQLAQIRTNLARMREESRESLRRLAATRAAADVSQAARVGEKRTGAGAVPPA